MKTIKTKEKLLTKAQTKRLLEYYDYPDITKVCIDDENKWKVYFKKSDRLHLKKINVVEGIYWSYGDLHDKVIKEYIITGVKRILEWVSWNSCIDRTNDKKWLAAHPEAIKNSGVN